MSLLASYGVAGVVRVVEAGDVGDVNSGCGQFFDDQVKFSNICELINI